MYMATTLRWEKSFNLISAEHTSIFPRLNDVWDALAHREFHFYVIPSLDGCIWHLYLFLVDIVTIVSEFFVGYGFFEIRINVFSSPRRCGSSATAIYLFLRSFKGTYTLRRKSFKREWG